MESNFIFDIKDDLKSPLLVFFSTLFIYNLGYYRTILFNGEPQRGSAEWMKKHSSYWIFSILFSLLAIIYIFSSFSIKSQAIVGILSLFSFLYIIHEIKFTRFTLSIRSIPVFKLVLVSGIWMLVTILPQLVEHDLFESQVAWQTLMAERFLFILPITMIFDVRDMESDPIDLKTLPKLTSVAFTKGLAILSLALAYFFFYNLQFPSLIDIIMLLLYLAMLVTILYSKSSRGELYYSGWFDALMGLHALIIIGYYLA
jgi:hypothetical protein